MSASVVGGRPISWQASADDVGWRTYKVRWLVAADKTDGLPTILNASGLPSVGSSLSLSGFTGSDSWAWCRPEVNVRIAPQIQEGDPAQYYVVETTYSNKPRWRCQDLDISNPLLEPQKISGTFRMAQKEMRVNLDGKRLVYSSGQEITGPIIMMDYAAPSIHIEQNVGSLGLSTFSAMINTVNDRTIWGVPARFLKMTGASWERKIYGRCGYYYTRSFDFEVNNFTIDDNGDLIGWDKVIYDASTQVLLGHWHTRARTTVGGVDQADPDYGKYIIDGGTWYTMDGDPPPDTGGVANVLKIPQKDVGVYRDMNGAYTRCDLDGHGLPAYAEWKQVDPETGAVLKTGTAGARATAILQFHRESNFLLLGIPTVL
jgi:hypothetical protein